MAQVQHATLAPDPQSAPEAYKGNDFPDDACKRESIVRLREHIQHVNDALVCLVCLEALQREDHVWSCIGGCYDTVHLACIQAWARQQILAAAAREHHSSTDAPEQKAEPWWGCPKCRQEYAASQLPTKYLCYCGAEENPQPSAWLPAHSCGATCSRELPCGHKCLLLCHPGPCPICPRQVAARCHCGRREEERRCHQFAFSCGKLCGSRHSCGHRCPLLCHPGPCPPCKLTSSRTCQCGAQTSVVPCARKVFQCDRTCGRQLACGHHVCNAVCHEGPCGVCALTGLQTCPCGKVSYEGLSCTEATPTCGGTCDKLLQCGQHRCAERCHTGPCSATCRAMTHQSCACGRLHKEAPCCEVLRCDTKCSRVRGCGRHPCRRRCCDGNCPPCPEECHRKLRCGNHRCRAPCHKGACLPCPLQFSVSCACGAACSRLPCGWESRARPPPCSHPCPVVRTCRHAEQLPSHRCHFGSCPPCDIPCGTKQPCGHTCASRECHDAPPPPVLPFQQPPPPQQPTFATADPSASAMKAAVAAVTATPATAEAAAAAAEMRTGPQSSCGDCRQPVVQWCQGHHTLQSRPCCDQGLLFSCNRPCGRHLPCGSHFESGVHSCSKACHPTKDHGGSPVAMTEGVAAVPGCESCEEVCGRARVCGHVCAESCHSGPCGPCSETISQPCHCERSTIAVTCSALTEDANGELLRCDKTCHRPLQGCTHLCQERCHPGACPLSGDACKQDVAVRCSCRHRKDRWPCGKVQLARVAAGQAPSFDDGAALRLLPCDASCQSFQAQKARKPTRDGPMPGSTTDGASSAPAIMRKREGKAAQNGRQREQANQATDSHMPDAWQKQWRLMRRWIRRNGVPGMLLCLGLLLAAVVYRTLAV